MGQILLTKTEWMLRNLYLGFNEATYYPKKIYGPCWSTFIESTKSYFYTSEHEMAMNRYGNQKWQLWNGIAFMNFFRSCGVSYCCDSLRMHLSGNKHESAFDQQYQAQSLFPVDDVVHEQHCQWHLQSITPTFYEELLCQLPFAKKIQT